MTSFELLALLNVVAARVRAEAVEAERRRIGAELHDQVGQDLTYALLALGRLERDLPDELRPRFDDAIAPIHAALSDVGRLAAGLRPAVLDELGLRAGLAALAPKPPRMPGCASTPLLATWQACPRISSWRCIALRRRPSPTSSVTPAPPGRG